MTTAATVTVVGESTVGDVIARDLARAKASLDELEKGGAGATLAAGGLGAMFAGFLSGLPNTADQIAAAVKTALDQIAALPGAQIKLLDDEAVNAIHAVATGVEALGMTAFDPVRITADDSDVFAKARAVETRLAQIQDKTVTLTVNIVTNGSLPDVSAATPGPAAPGNAAGTLSAPGGLSLVGERGPELVSLPRGAQVFDALSTRSLLDTLSGRGGDQYLMGDIHIYPPSGADFLSLLAQAKQAGAA
jgi:hypothetical protein